MPCKMFQGGEYPFPVFELFISLNSFHCGRAHLSAQPGIFTKGLLDRPPATVSRDIPAGAKGMVASTETRFPRDTRVDLFYPAGIEGPGPSNPPWNTAGAV